jgi:hypothetical protein
VDYWRFNATFSNISAISWRPVLIVEEAGKIFMFINIYVHEIEIAHKFVKIKHI